MKQRDLSIDILKFIACLAITNSHFDVVYGPLSPIATGGAIGDILFFFASGFTIFLSSRGGGNSMTITKGELTEYIPQYLLGH